MRGLTPASGWTHLLAGMILAGVGAGLVNVPLVSTAVGVVEPARAGMASGINSTLRQVGVATGVAALGSIFASQVRSSVVGRLAAPPCPQLLTRSRSASPTAQRHTRSPPPPRHCAAWSPAPRGPDSSSGLNEILLVGAIVAFAGAVASFALIRERDFITTEAGKEHAETLAVAACTHIEASRGRGRRRVRRPAGRARPPAGAGRGDLSTGENFHLFQPLVYQVATGALSPAEIATPLRSILRRQRNARVMLAEVTGFDLDARARSMLDRLPTAGGRALALRHADRRRRLALLLFRPRRVAGATRRS